MVAIIATFSVSPDSRPLGKMLENFDFKTVFTMSCRDNSLKPSLEILAESSKKGDRFIRNIGIKWITHGVNFIKTVRNLIIGKWVHNVAPIGAILVDLPIEFLSLNAISLKYST